MRRETNSEDKRIIVDVRITIFIDFKKQHGFKN